MEINMSNARLSPSRIIKMNPQKIEQVSAEKT